MTKEEYENFQMLNETEQFNIRRNWSGKQWAEYLIQQNGGKFMTIEDAKHFSQENLKKLYDKNDNI